MAAQLWVYEVSLWSVLHSQWSILQAFPLYRVGQKSGTFLNFFLR